MIELSNQEHMPTYEYRCGACQHEFESFQRMSDEPRAECPVCGKEAIRRLSGGVGLLFKGSGFYITDYRSDSYKKAAGAEGGADKGSEKSGGEKKEAKPAGGDGSGSSSKTGSKTSSPEAD